MPSNKIEPLTFCGNIAPAMEVGWPQLPTQTYYNLTLVLVPLSSTTADCWHVNRKLCRERDQDAFSQVHVWVHTFAPYPAEGGKPPHYTMGCASSCCNTAHGSRCATNTPPSPTTLMSQLTIESGIECVYTNTLVVGFLGTFCGPALQLCDMC
jgi:hypothetical protein